MIPQLGNLDDLLTHALVFTLISTRLGFLFVTAPLFSSPVIPRRFRGGIIAAVAFVLYLGLDAPSVPSFDIVSFVISALGEAAIGATAGFGASILFAAVEGAGRLLGIPMGLGFANVVDPLTQTDSVVTSRFLITLMSLLFLALDVHHVLLRLIARSFVLLPPGYAVLSRFSAMSMVQSASLIFSGTVQLAAPVLVVLLGVMFALGILAKVAPKLNLFVLSFAVSIALGLMAMRIALPQLVMWMKQGLVSIEPITVRALDFIRL